MRKPINTTKSLSYRLLVASASLCGLALLSFAVWFLILINHDSIDRHYFKELLWLRTYPLDQHTGDGDKVAVATMWGFILNGVIIGSVTFCTAIIALAGLLIQLRKDANKSFLEWLVNFNQQFHQDEDYAAVRVSLAQHRTYYLLQMLIELQSDHQDASLTQYREFLDEMKTLHVVDLPGHLDKDIPVYLTAQDKPAINWDLIRKMTDYFRFYEMVLMVGLHLPAASDRSNFFGCYAWHIYWLARTWPRIGDSDANSEFIAAYYFAFNRYEQLASVCVFLLDERIAGEADEKVRDKLQRRMDDLKALYARRCRMPLLDRKCLRNMWHPAFGDHTRMSE